MAIDLSALLDKPAQKNDGLPLRLNLVDIEPDPNQPRSEKRQEEIAEIGENIKDRGVKLPISVKPHPTKPDKWIINDGELRYLGSLYAGLQDIPVVIDHDFDDFDQVNANEKRFALRPMDLALFVQRKLNEGFKKTEIARRLGKNAASITIHLALIDLPLCIKNIYETERCTSPQTLYELKSLYNKYPEDIEKWCENNEEITRKTVSILADNLNKENTADDEHCQSEHTGDTVETVDEPQNLFHEKEIEVTSTVLSEDTGEGFNTNRQENNNEIENTDTDTEKDKGNNFDPTRIKKPLLFVEYKGRVAKVLLNRLPSGPGLIHINYEGEKEEIEVDAKRCKIHLLIEGRK